LQELHQHLQPTADPVTGFADPVSSHRIISYERIGAGDDLWTGAR
jgi:hypothetical protein